MNISDNFIKINIKSIFVIGAERQIPSVDTDVNWLLDSGRTDGCARSVSNETLPEKVFLINQDDMRTVGFMSKEGKLHFSSFNFDFSRSLRGIFRNQFSI